jgi:XRE family transcriptional regulator of biofilm formation
MLGDNIKKLREQKGLSINALANICNISPGYLSDLEKNNKQNPSTSMLEKISSVLGVSAQTLLKENMDEPDEIDRLEEDMKILFSKMKDLSPNDRKKILDIITIFEKENNE